MDTFIFIVVDIIIFFLLWLGLKLHWILASLLSTGITWLLFYAWYALCHTSAPPS